MRFSAWLTVFQVTLLAALVDETARGAIFTETWESPAITPGATSTLLPIPWSVFPGSSTTPEIVYPNVTSDFDQVSPLSAPAGGNQALRLGSQNTGISRLSGDLIIANTTYVLSAAIGNDGQSAVRNDSWSLQLWVDSNGNGIFDGSISDAFIGQQFGTHIGAINPSAGQWATNSFTFDSAARPDLVGKQLVVFLNNFDLPNSASYYDNVTLTAAPNQAAVPEPASLALWSFLAVGGIVASRRKTRVEAHT